MESTSQQTLDMSSHDAAEVTADHEDSAVTVTVATFFNDKNTKLKKPNKMIGQPQKAMPTVMQHRIINVLLRMAYDNRDLIKEGRLFELSLSTCLQLLESKTRNLRHIDSVLSSMANIHVKTTTYKENGVLKERAVLFSYIETFNNVIRFKIEPEAIRLLTKKCRYTPIDQREINKLSKVGSIPLFELISKYVSRGATRWAPWKEVRSQIIGTDNELVNGQDWGRFNARYIGPAIKEINEKTHLKVDLEIRRVGKLVDTIRFIVVKPGVRTPATEFSQKELRIVNKLKSYGGTDEKIREVLIDHHLYEIEKSIAYCEDQFTRLGKGKSRRFYFFSNALEQRSYQNLTGSLQFDDVSSDQEQWGVPGPGIVNLGRGKIIDVDHAIDVEARVVNNPPVALSMQARSISKAARSIAKPAPHIALEGDVKPHLDALAIPVFIGREVDVKDNLKSKNAMDVALRKEQMLRVQDFFMKLVNESPDEMYRLIDEYNSSDLVKANPSISLVSEKPKKNAYDSFHGWYIDTYGMTNA